MMRWPEQMQWITGTERLSEHQPLAPFALDEVWCRRLGGEALPAVHVWRHPSALILGLRDRKLPYAEEAMTQLRADGEAVVVRSSGGAAVPLDSGVVNVSLLLPIPERTHDFRADFRIMAELIAEAASAWSDRVVPGEIAGAYCPGDFDLSIGGRKFCGISQRRQARGFALQAFVNVTGSGELRAERAARYYRMAVRESVDAKAYPSVVSGTMASLEELCGTPSPEAFIQALRSRLVEAGVRLTEFAVDEPLRHEIEAASENLRTRYDK